MGSATSGAVCTLLTIGAAWWVTPVPRAYGHELRVHQTALFVTDAGCPAPVARSQHVSTGDVVPTSSGASVKNGVLVASGQTVFYAGHAPKGVDTTGSKGKPSPAPLVTAASGDVVSHPVTPTRTVTSTHSTRPSGKTVPMWTVQVASYESLDQAQSLELTLCQKGYAARVIGTNKPFTVQVGAYPSSDSAMVVARRLSSRELTVFVTQAKH